MAVKQGGFFASLFLCIEIGINASVAWMLQFAYCNKYNIKQIKLYWDIGWNISLPLLSVVLDFTFFTCFAQSHMLYGSKGSRLQEYDGHI